MDRTGYDPIFDRRADGRPLPTRAELGLPPLRPRRQKPIWWIFPALMALAWVLQAIPLVGIFMLLVLAPLWPVVLINLTLIAIAVDALRGAIPRIMVAVPILVYVATVGTSLASWMAWKDHVAEVERSNAAQPVVFDWRTSDLVMEQGEGGLVSRYTLPVVFQKSSSSEGGYSATQVLPKSVCDSLEKPKFNTDMSIDWVSVDRSSVGNACQLRFPVQPTRPVTTVSRRLSKEGGLLDLETSTIEIRPPAGAPARVRAVKAGLLPPIPLVMAGCWLDLNAGGKWVCDTVILRLPVKSGDWWSGATRPDVLRVLGLKPRRLIEQPGRSPRRKAYAFDEAEMAALAAPSAPTVARARAYAEAETQRQLAMFDVYLAGEETATPDGLNEWGVITNADRLAGQAGRIIAAIERADKERGESRRRLLVRVAAALPSEAFAPIAGRLLQQVAADPDLARNEAVLIRMGDVGPQAGSFLVEQLKDRRGSESGVAAMLGLCRLGAYAPSGAAEAIAAAAQPGGKRYQDNARAEAAIVTLARLGRPDLAQPLTVGFNGRRAEWAQAQLAEVGPKSSANRCRTWRNGGNLPDLPWLKA